MVDGRFILDTNELIYELHRRNILKKSLFLSFFLCLGIVGAYAQQLDLDTVIKTA